MLAHHRGPLLLALSCRMMASSLPWQRGRVLITEEAHGYSDGTDMLRTALSLAIKPQQRSLKVRLLGVRQRLDN